MSDDIVKIACKLDCRWEGLTPTYRAWVNNELFTERSWIWTENYIEEIFQIKAIPGKYVIRFELVQPCLADLIFLEMRPLHGPVRVKSGGVFLIGS